MSPCQSLDHLILFLPFDPNTTLPQLPSFFAKNFTLTPGGHHADKKTSNTLIILADGCYIELISFLSPDSAPSHWWGPDANFVGWKDWCLTNTLKPEESYEHVKESHDEPVRGGRKRADGVDVKWAVTFPKGGQGVRGRVPFFCHDVTDRSVRVPVGNEKTKHACGALGVREISIVVKDKNVLAETSKVYDSVLGKQGSARGDEVLYHINRVIDVDGLDGGAKIILRLPKDKIESEKVETHGFWYGDIVLVAEAGAGRALGARERLDAQGGDDDDDVRGLWIEYV